MSTIDTSYASPLAATQSQTSASATKNSSTVSNDTTDTTSSTPVDTVEISDEAKALAATSQSNSTSNT
ncbi:MAG: hypothetical protein EOM49_06615, partial [Epsilonproteobacteria bacterium]|nr:hypothetical protein [Campylobacterota bacterium]